MQNFAQSLLKIVVFLGVMMATAGAWAQSADDLTQARGLHADAQRDKAAGETWEALLKLRDAYDLSGDHAVVYEIATLFESLRNYERAASHFELYLRLSPNAKYAERIKNHISELRQKGKESQAWIDVQTEPPGARVYVEDFKRPVKLSPAMIPVGPGRRKLRIVRDGYHSKTIEIQVIAGETVSETVEMEPLDTAEAPLELEVFPVETDAPPEVVARDEPVASWTTVDSSPPMFAQAFAWTSIIVGFWATIWAFTPPAAESRTTLLLIGGASVGLGGYLLMGHDWAPSPDDNGSGGASVRGISFSGTF